MDAFRTPVDCVGVSLIREGELVAIAYIYDLETAESQGQAAIDLYLVAAHVATILNVPLHMGANDGEN